jgi:hypothetical protein
MKCYHFTLWIMLLSSCSILKKNSKTTDESLIRISNDTESQTAAFKSKQISQQQINYQRDSSGGDYTIRFWPKGKVDYSPGGMISAEYDSILMKGNQHQLTSAISLLGINAMDSSKFTNNTRHKNRRTLAKKKVEKVSIPDIRLILLVTFVVTIGSTSPSRGCFVDKILKFESL